MKNGDRRIHPESFIPQMYVAGVWLNLEYCQDTKCTEGEDVLIQKLIQEHGVEWWEEAKEYLEYK